MSADPTFWEAILFGLVLLAIAAGFGGLPWAFAWLLDHPDPVDWWRVRKQARAQRKAWRP